LCVSEQKNEDNLEHGQNHQSLAENKSKEHLQRKSHTRLDGKAQDSTLVIEARWIPPKSYPNPLKKYTYLLEKQEGGNLDVIAVDIPDLNKPITTPGASRSERPETDSTQKQSSEGRRLYLL
jgi:hypothetical protein